MSQITILNRQALDELRARAAGTIHTYALARMHGRPVRESLQNMDETLVSLESVEDKLRQDLALVSDSINMLRHLRATLEEVK